MWGLRPIFGFVSSGIVSVCLGAAPAQARVVISFSGTVTALQSEGGATPPAGVSFGDPVSGTLSYNPGDARVTQEDPWRSSYDFELDHTLEFQVTIGAQSWITAVYHIFVCNDSCSGDLFLFNAGATSSSGFPGYLGVGSFIGLGYSDNVEPYTFLNGTDLPHATQDVDLSTADSASGTIASYGDTGEFWAIYFAVDTSTLPVSTMSWSRVKRLYDSPEGPVKKRSLQFCRLLPSAHAGR